VAAVAEVVVWGEEVGGRGRRARRGEGRKGVLFF
jgi:hypothetical protein